jgi:hypothetical protein
MEGLRLQNTPNGGAIDIEAQIDATLTHIIVRVAATRA